MGVSHYFREINPRQTNEQTLFENLAAEAIHINGMDVQYIPRESYGQIDNIFGEDVLSKFDKAYTMEMYMNTTREFEGDGEFFSKFGLEMRDNAKLTVAAPTFKKYVPAITRPRPREGDLVYVPGMKKLFEIKFVEEKRMFYTLGKYNAYIYELQVETFRYSNETINTGIEDVDSVEVNNAYTAEIILGSGTGNYYIGEQVYQGVLASPTFTAVVVDWNPTGKLLKVQNTAGTITANSAIIGVDSTTSYTATDEESIQSLAPYDLYDNRTIETQANTFIDIISDPNVFGTP